MHIQASIAKRAEKDTPQKVFSVPGCGIGGSERVPGAFLRVGYMECRCNKNVMADSPAYVETRRTLKLV